MERMWWWGGEYTILILMQPHNTHIRHTHTHTHTYTLLCRANWVSSVIQAVRRQALWDALRRNCLYAWRLKFTKEMKILLQRGKKAAATTLIIVDAALFESLSGGNQIFLIHLFSLFTMFHKRTIFFYLCKEDSIISSGLCAKQKKKKTGRSMTTRTRCWRSCWLPWQGVGVVIDEWTRCPCNP